MAGRAFLVSSARGAPLFCRRLSAECPLARSAFPARICSSSRARAARLFFADCFLQRAPWRGQTWWRGSVPARPIPARPTPAQLSPAQPSPAQPRPSTGQPSPAQASPAQASPAPPSPAQPSPAQPSPAQPRPGQHSPAQPWCLPILILAELQNISPFGGFPQILHSSLQEPGGGICAICATPIEDGGPTPSRCRE